MELINTENAKKSYFLPTNYIFFIISLLYITSLSWVYGDSGTTVSSSYNFSNVTCSEGIGNVLLTGQFNNNDTFYKVIFLKMLILDKNGHVLAMGNGYISDVKPHEIKIFNAITRFNSDFSSCSVQIDNVIPK
jgi:hypothetical protein